MLYMTTSSVSNKFQATHDLTHFVEAKYLCGDYTVGNELLLAHVPKHVQVLLRVLEGSEQSRVGGKER